MGRKGHSVTGVLTVEPRAARGPPVRLTFSFSSQSCTPAAAPSGHHSSTQLGAKTCSPVLDPWASKETQKQP